MSDFDKHDLSGLIGQQLIYTYENGWEYELYVKNETTVDYRIHSGIVGGRWVRDQKAYYARLSKDVYKVSWTEPTGTSVSLSLNLNEKLTHGTIFFPRWIMNNPDHTVCYQNDYLDKMAEYREAGPTYPIEVIDEYSKISFLKYRGANNEEVINCAASDLPEDFPNNL